MPDTTPTNGTQDQQTETIETAEAAEATVPDSLCTIDRFEFNQSKLVCITKLLMLSPGLELSGEAHTGLCWILQDIATDYRICFERLQGS